MHQPPGKWVGGLQASKEQPFNLALKIYWLSLWLDKVDIKFRSFNSYQCHGELDKWDELKLP